MLFCFRASPFVSLLFVVDVACSFVCSFLHVCVFASRSCLIFVGFCVCVCVCLGCSFLFLPKLVFYDCGCVLFLVLCLCFVVVAGLLVVDVVPVRSAGARGMLESL